MDLAQLFFGVFVITLFELFAVIGILLVKKHRIIPGIKYFAVVLFCFVLFVLKDFATNNWEYHSYAKFHRILFLSYQLGFIVGPMMYFYVRETAGIPLKTNFKYFHFIPFLAAIILATLHILKTNIFVIWWSPLDKPLSISMCVISLIYFVLSLKILKQNNFYFPYLNSNNKQKLNIFIYLFLFALLIYWSFKLVSIYYLRHNLITDEVFWILTYIVKSLIIFISLSAFLIAWLGNQELLITKNRKISSFIEKKDTSEYLQQLIYLLEVDKQFKDSELTLNKLSGILNINPRYLSHIINNELNKSFTDLVNTYRIKESELLLIHNPEKTVQEIMYEVGFNSKSTFNTLFKSETSITPKEYRLKNLAQLSKTYN